MNSNCSEILLPPGHGVYTVHTGQEQKDALNSHYYPKSLDTKASHKQALKSFDASSPAVFGIASDCGGGILRGANWGPLFARLELIKSFDKKSYFDLGDIPVIPHLLHDKYLNEETISNCQKALYNNSEKFPVSPLSLAEFTLDQLYQEYPRIKILGLGGDHSVSYPLVSTYLRHKKKQGIKTGIIHFDAHTDLLLERLGIDLCFGSWLSHVIELLESPKNIFQLGIRSSGKNKEHWEKKFGLNQLWANEMIRTTPEKISKGIIKKLRDQKVEELYISFDIDALDANLASSTGTPEKKGLSPEFCSKIISHLSKEISITGCDFVELAPFSNPMNIKNSQKTTLDSANTVLTSLLTELSLRP